jgi:hypothetical protein
MVTRGEYAKVMPCCETIPIIFGGHMSCLVVELPGASICVLHFALVPVGCTPRH